VRFASSAFIVRSKPLLSFEREAFFYLWAVFSACQKEVTFSPNVTHVLPSIKNKQKGVKS